jgi:DNA gyrase subunit A
MVIRQKVGNIKTISRNTQGVRLINLNDNDKVNDITRIMPEPDDETIDKEAERLAQVTEVISTWEDDVEALGDDILSDEIDDSADFDLEETEEEEKESEE